MSAFNGGEPGIVADDILQGILPRLIGERDDAVDLKDQRLAVGLRQCVEGLDQAPRRHRFRELSTRPRRARRRTSLRSKLSGLAPGSF